MSPWNALPWNTIIAIIGVSLLIPSILAIVYMKFKRFEDLGMTIGVFLILLGVVSYAYLIPTAVVNEAILPENYIWEDQGTISYWERNSVFSQDNALAQVPLELSNLITKRSPIEKNFIGKEIIHAVEMNSDKTKMLIHDALYDDKGAILRVINDQESVSEWYMIDPHLSKLLYTDVNGGHMGIPMNPNGKNTIPLGWVESNGTQDGQENVVLQRNMQRIQEGKIDGVDVIVWQSDIYNKQITWHGESYLCDETLRLTVHPKTGYVIHVYRHLVLSARLSQFIKLYYPDSLGHRAVTNYLKLSDPIGEAAELTYTTTPDSQARHLAEVKGYDNLMTSVPLLICIPMFLIGIPLTWRYYGRSYYWKRYKNFEEGFPSVSGGKRKKISRKKLFAIGLASILLVSSLGVILYTSPGTLINTTPSEENHHDEQVSFVPEPPTPPGTDRTVDSGKHTLLPIDEGAHKLSRREWWYFNVYFNDPQSELQNYSMIISFNKMALNDIRLLKRDNLFIIMYDDKESSTNYGIMNKPRGTLQMSGPGVDLSFENSYVKGQYPQWTVHVENTEKGFTADLTFTADFLPVWVMGRSSNLVLFKYLGGDYYIPRCTVEGNITIGSNQHQVKGTGYHDHVWETIVPRLVTKGWEWFNLHFDNGWEMYLSKFILRTPRNLYAAALVISPNNRNLIEYKFFEVTYTETATPQGMPFMSYPKKYHVEAKVDDMVLKLDITISNTCEIVWKAVRTGMFEGPCTATGTFSWENYTVDLQGYGMSEITRVKYLFQLPGIFLKKDPMLLQRFYP